MIAVPLAVLMATSGFTLQSGQSQAGESQHLPAWQLSTTGSAARLRGLAPVSARVAWASGSGGTVLLTVDGGHSWSSVGPPGTADLQYRDIEAFDARHAVILSIGEADQSRVYVTGDGGSTWTETFVNDDPAAFYDCMAFFDPRHGLAMSDPVGGFFRILSTSDGGRSWVVLPTDRMPPALDGEFGFAASGTCLTAVPGTQAWFASGGGGARVFHTTDRGRSWSVAQTPVPSGPSAGIYSLAFRPSGQGIAVGGDFAVPTAAPDGAAVSADAGRSWSAAATAPGEYRSGSAWLPGTRSTAIAVGPTGSDISYDGGRNWLRFDTGSFDAVACAPDGACWASGETGRVAVLQS
ncbi:MAG: oxidoreductase [Micromonosporaceae bacterium]|nr:oxidoreductase [Micromonosporaceae bacterium]